MRIHPLKSLREKITCFVCDHENALVAQLHRVPEQRHPDGQLVEMIVTGKKDGVLTIETNFRCTNCQAHNKKVGYINLNEENTQ